MEQSGIIGEKFGRYIPVVSPLFFEKSDAYRVLVITDHVAVVDRRFSQQLEEFVNLRLRGHVVAVGPGKVFRQGKIVQIFRGDLLIFEISRVIVMPEPDIDTFIRTVCGDHTEIEVKPKGIQADGRPFRIDPVIMVQDIGPPGHGPVRRLGKSCAVDIRRRFEIKKQVAGASVKEQVPSPFCTTAASAENATAAHATIPKKAAKMVRFIALYTPEIESYKRAFN